MVVFSVSVLRFGNELTVSNGALHDELTELDPVAAARMEPTNARRIVRALEVIEPVYGMSRPAADDDSRRARDNRATYELHDRAGDHTSILFAQKRFPTASEQLLGGSSFPAMQNLLLAAVPAGAGSGRRLVLAHAGILARSRSRMVHGHVGLPP